MLKPTKNLNTNLQGPVVQKVVLISPADNG